jgi:hypothetical protein
MNLVFRYSLIRRIFVGNFDPMSIAADLNQCYRKRVFRDPKRAQKTADHYNQVSPPPDGKLFHAYSCPVCFKWHVGRTDKTKGKK